MQYQATAFEVVDLSALFGFPEDPGFSLENSHFYLDDHRYSAFCVAMQRARQCGLIGSTQAEMLSDWRARRARSAQETRE